MKVLLDENFPLRLLKALLREGIDAEHIITLDLRGASDSTIQARLDHEAIVLLTNDTEFLMAPMPESGWVIVSRVRQSRKLDERIEVWVRTIRSFLTSTPASRINELFDDGQLLPWHDATPERREELRTNQSTPAIVKVLGVDVASANWVSNGSALISFDANSRLFRAIDVPAITWPSVPLTAMTLATAIDHYARDNDVRAVALDGPQGWRDPETPAGLPGVGRRCEFECRTQGKTGVYPRTFPGNQRGWIEFCVQVFDVLLERKDVRLAHPNDPRTPPLHGYVILECFPTSAWRSSGLDPLPAKLKRPALENYAAALAAAYGLPLAVDEVRSHDDLQAVVAALAAAAAVGGPAEATLCGTAAKTTTAVPTRLEGYIWNARPLAARANSSSEPQFAPLPGSKWKGPAVRVTQKVIDQVARGVCNQEQIVLRHLPGGTARARTTIRLELAGEEYGLIVGDTHVAWRSQQDSVSVESFDRLFALLSDTPDMWRPVTQVPDGE